MKFGCAICIFLNYENLICRSAGISKCIRGSLQLQDNELTTKNLNRAKELHSPKSDLAGQRQHTKDVNYLLLRAKSKPSISKGCIEGYGNTRKYIKIS